MYIIMKPKKNINDKKNISFVSLDNKIEKDNDKIIKKEFSLKELIANRISK